MIKRMIARLRDDSGVTAMIVAVAGVALIGAASLAIDISRFTYQRELTRDAIEAGAQAGAYYLPDNPTAAIAAAEAAARYVDAESTPVATLLCVVPYESSLGTYDSSTVGMYCNPGPSTKVGLTTYYPESLYPGKKCSSKYGVCTLPCTAPCQVDRSVSPVSVTGTYTFNSISVSASSTVQYLFGPIMNQFSKSFDAAANMTAACKGAGCLAGNTPPTPMNIVIVLDRTGSVPDADRRAMVKSIEGMFGLMEPKVQFVALAPMGKSVTSGNCLTAPASTTQIQTPGNSTKWVAVPYAWNYLNANRTLNTSSDIVAKALGQGNSSGDVCLSAAQSNNPPGSFLAASLKGAALYLLNPNNLAGAPARSGAVQNVIFFESDGEPYDSYDMPGGSSTSLDDTKEVFFKENSYSGGQNATQCQNLKTVAENAKAKGITIFSVAFGADGTNCGSGDAVAAMAAVAGKYVKNADGTTTKEVSLPNYTQTSSTVWDSSLTYQGQVNCPATSSNDPKYATCWTTTQTWNSNNTYASTSSCSGVSSSSRNQTDYPSCYSLQPQWDATNTFAGTVDCGDIASGKRNETDYPSCYKGVKTWNVGGSVTYSGTVDCADIKSSAYSQSRYPDCYKRTTFNTSTTYSGTVSCADIKSTAYSQSVYPDCYKAVPTWNVGGSVTYSGTVSCADIKSSAYSQSRYPDCYKRTTFNMSTTYSGTVDCADVKSGSYSKSRYANCYTWTAGATFSTSSNMSCGDIDSSARGTSKSTRYSNCYSSGSWSNSRTYTGTVRCNDIIAANRGTLTGTYAGCWQWDTANANNGTVYCGDISSSAQASYLSCYDVAWDTTKSQTGTVRCADISSSAQSSYPNCYSDVTTWDTTKSQTGTVRCADISSSAQSSYLSCYDVVWDTTKSNTGTVRCADISTSAQSTYTSCYSMVPTWDTTKTQTGTIACADISSNQSSYPLCYDQVMQWNTSLTYPVQKTCPGTSSTNATYDSCWDSTTTWKSSNKYTGAISCNTVSSGSRSQSNYPTCYGVVWTNTTNCDPTIENTDGDRFFCAASGSDFANIFKTAFLQLFKNSKFIRIP